MKSKYYTHISLTQYHYLRNTMYLKFSILKSLLPHVSNTKQPYNYLNPFKKKCEN